uniref:Uncharacterized protein n=1 Tax=Abalone asfa-like virus TaxID=2839893 RepID=A0A5K7XZB1_9VIRU|nr:hypothetical protein [Abalone asfa-like virus]
MEGCSKCKMSKAQKEKQIISDRKKAKRDRDFQTLSINEMPPRPSFDTESIKEVLSIMKN